MFDITADARFLGKLGVLNWVMIPLEAVAAGFAGWHLWNEKYLIAAGVFLIEIAILGIHAIAMLIEKRLHRIHERRVDRLDGELGSKAESLMTTADRVKRRLGLA